MLRQLLHVVALADIADEALCMQSFPVLRTAFKLQCEPILMDIVHMLATNPCILFHHVETIRAGLFKSLKHLPNAYAGFGFPAYGILKILKIYSEGLRRDVEKLAEAGSQKAKQHGG